MEGSNVGVSEVLPIGFKRLNEFPLAGCMTDDVTTVVFNAAVQIMTGR